MLLAGACSKSHPDIAPMPATTTVEKVLILEATGTQVHDTTVTFALATGRTIVMRHPVPDDALFLILQFPPVKDSLRVRDSVRVTILPVHGKYGFLLNTTDKLGAGVQATFSYAIHFKSPAEAVTKYPSPGRLEAQLIPALLGEANKVEFLTGTRPAADMIRFPVVAAGMYALTALR